MNPSKKPVNCNDYRQEMILLGLVRKLSDPELSDSERKRIAKEIEKIERQMGM